MLVHRQLFFLTISLISFCRVNFTVKISLLIRSYDLSLIYVKFIKSISNAQILFHKGRKVFTKVFTLQPLYLTILHVLMY